ncbi:MAG: hypothetical protein AABZ30_03670, partial [Myxococcota bacterium]
MPKGSAPSRADADALGAPAGHDADGFYDEMFDASGAVRAPCRPLFERLLALGQADRRRRQSLAERALLELGITFLVYKDKDA